MRRARLSAAGAVAVGAAGAVGAATATTAARRALTPARRTRIGRTIRVWRLTARRSAHWAIVRVRGARADQERRAHLESQFAIRSAEDVAKELGNMKGAIMKAGQMISFIAEGLPPEAQAALATLQADVPPMAPSLAERVIVDELGDVPERLFLDWDPIPVAAASIGQVHKAVMPDGRLVAVKVQYPGVADAITSDLDNAELLYGMFASLSLKNMDVKGIVDELRSRMADELDYRIEARCQTEFADLYRGHPFIHVPDVIPERSATRVLTSDWVEGMTWDQFLATAGWDERQRAAEIIFRFAQESIHLHGVFNGDPHPGNYRFQHDGRVTFLDFGLVKRWTPGELESLSPVLDAVMARDPQAVVDRMVAAGFLADDHGLDADHVWEYVSRPYLPYLEDEFTYTPEFVGQTIAAIIDLNGPYKDVITSLNMPTSFVILDRVVWGVSALLGRLGATGNWRDRLAEYRVGAPPCTVLGEMEARWRLDRR